MAGLLGALLGMAREPAPSDEGQLIRIGSRTPGPRPGSARLALLVLAFLATGLIGHDPWKSDDAIGFGVAYGFLSGTGDHGWLIPSLAGEAFTRDGPLYYWLAALCARLFSPLLPLPDGARLASLIGVGLALYFTRRAGRELYGKRAGDLSLLALLGCVGLLVHARVTAPETLALAAVAAAYYGVAIAWKKPLKAALFVGIGLAAALLSKGLQALAPPLLAIVLLLPHAVSIRRLTFVRAAALGIALGALLSLPWLVLVAARDPAYLAAWWSSQRAGFSLAAQPGTWLDYVKTLAWAAWPAWPLALWAIWTNRRNLNEVAVTVPLSAALVSLVVLFLNPDRREIDALTLLVPLAIPAGGVALSLRRGAANALAWFSIMTFSLVIVLAWALWLATATGFPATMASTASRLEPGFVLSISWLAIGCALAYTVCWAALVLRFGVTPERSLQFWCAGITATAGTALLLAHGWINYGKSYATVAQSLRQHLPRRTECVNSLGLGEAQRAALHYHGGFVTRPVEDPSRARCSVLLVQSYAGQTESVDPAKWRRLWEARRPRDRERYRLYQQRSGSAAR